MTRHTILYLHITSVLAGAENSLLNLLSRLDKENFRPFFVCPCEGPFVDELRALNVEVDFVEFPRLRKFSFAVIKRLKGMIKSKGIDLIHSSGTSTNLYAAISARLSGIPVVWHARNLPSGNMWDVDSFLSFLPDKIICNSEAVRRRFCKEGKTRKKVITIINGVDTERFNPGISGQGIRDEFNISSETAVIGIAGRLDPAKGHECFVEAAREIDRCCQDVCFLIVGESAFSKHNWFQEHLEKVVKQAGLENKVIFTGFRTDMPEMLAAMDIFVSASDTEACGRVLFESMATGIPVVATDTGGTPEIVLDRETGLLFPVRDHQALAKAALGLLNDVKMAREMGRKGRARTKEFFTIEEHVRKTENVYDELLRKTTCE